MSKELQKKTTQLYSKTVLKIEQKTYYICQEANDILKLSNISQVDIVRQLGTFRAWETKFQLEKYIEQQI